MTRQRDTSLSTTGSEPRVLRWLDWLLALMPGLVVFVIYWPVKEYPFITWDDPLYVTANPIVQQGLTWSNIGWAFTTFHAANWHPLTWLSHMLDCSLFGHETTEAAGRHRILNVALHAANATLLFALLRMATGSLWRSAAIAMFFAVHPLRVESVAWVSERKDVLSTFFGLAAMIAYVRWASTPSKARYAAIVLLMALSLMAKPMLVTLPGVLLLLDVWPLKRLDFAADAREVARRFVRLVVEKLPLIGLTIASCIMTVVAQATWSAFATIEMVSW
ncbi:MAG TPA: hypothetical protein VFX76_02630, partial [Roseiflexaceae bacterium]|nr:hypothetical protein [Roseiflexaceae bacterium]